MAKPKRPRDPNQLAALIVGLSTGEEQDADPDAGKNPAAVALGKLGGVKGGKARAAKMTEEQRKESAKKAIATRWNKRKGAI
jgi:hypothetical protein